MNIKTIKISDEISIINALGKTIAYHDDNGKLKKITHNRQLSSLALIEFKEFGIGNMVFKSMKMKQNFLRIAKSIEKTHGDKVFILLPLDKMLVVGRNTCSLGSPIKVDELGNEIYDLKTLYISLNE